MEIVTVVLLLVLIVLVAALLLKSGGEKRSEERMQSVLNEKFVGFQDAIHKTMETARREVEASKNIISDHAIKTLDTIRAMGTTLERMIQHQKEAQELGNSLKYLLQTPKLRGSYGEAILEEMLERALPRGIWEKQYSVEGSERVDAVVKYKDTIIPIDAKFPKESYENYLNAEPGEKKKKWKAYEDSVKTQINSIKSKYIKPHKGTSNFALMFIPSESIYYETIAERNYLDQPCDIFEYARNSNVFPVSPNTFNVFLQILLMSIRNLDIAKNAKKLQEALKKIEKNFESFYVKYETIGASLNKAAEAYKTGSTYLQRFKNNVESTVKMDIPESVSPPESPPEKR